jgi:hypothetical protein
VFRLQQKDGHLRPRDRAVAAIDVASSAAGRDPLSEDLLDGVVESIRAVDVQEVGEPSLVQRARRPIGIRHDDIGQRSRHP